MSDLADLLVYCFSDKRVCPQPQRWNDLYKMLPNTKRNGAGYEPALPLILAAWWEATDNQKKERMKIHVEWASKQGVLSTVGKFLRSLPEGEWHHEQ
jgi:hypothetical protein